MAVTAPKCPKCGVTEWRHLCSGASEPQIAKRLMPKFERPKTGPELKAALEAVMRPDFGKAVDPPDLVLGSVVVPGKVAEEVMADASFEAAHAKTDRKEYLKLKARERRAAKKAGLTVQEYRARNGEKPC